MTTIRKIETEHFVVHVTPWRWDDDRRDAKTRLYAGSLIDYTKLGSAPPTTVKGEDPANDKAWRAYNRAELNAMNDVLNEFELELHDTPDPDGLLTSLYEQLTGFTRNFSRRAGCSCGCSPGFRLSGKVYLKLGGVSETRVAAFTVSRKTPKPDRTFTMADFDTAAQS